MGGNNHLGEAIEHLWYLHRLLTSANQPFMEISNFRSRPSRSWDGYYYLLAYKRSRKLHLPMSGVDSVAKVVEPEVVAAPLLLGAPSPSRDVGIKDETWMARVVFPEFPGDLDVGCWMIIDSHRFPRHVSVECKQAFCILYIYIHKKTCRDVCFFIISPETHSDKRRKDHQLSQKDRLWMGLKDFQEIHLAKTDVFSKSWACLVMFS